MQEVEVVEVERDYLVLCVVALELHGNDPFDGLLQCALGHACGLVGVELLGQLLRDGRATAGVLLTEQASLDDGPGQCLEVDARVLVEAHVFGGHKRLHDVWRELVEIDAYPVFLVVVPCTHQFPVGGINLCGESVDWVLQVFDGWHVAYPAFCDGIESRSGGHHSHYEQCPEQMGDFLIHKCLFFASSVEFLGKISRFCSDGEKIMRFSVFFLR